MSFSAIPTLSIARARDPSTKSAFLAELKEALLNVGFFYISDTGISTDLTSAVIQQTRAFFETLPDEQKLAIEMKNERSFLGYSRLDNEITAGAVDHREQLDLATPHALPAPDAPLWHHLWGPNQWPAATSMPEFRTVMEDYMRQLSEVSALFMNLIAEALDMPADAFDRFFDADQLHKMKLVKYPDSGAGGGQGVGPHKDSMLTSYLLQGSEHRGLQAQNIAGEWVDCPPKEGTLVVALGQGLEAITDGVCQSTTHRVLSPRSGLGPRYSIPFFQGVSFDARFESMDVPAHVRQLKKESIEKAGGRRDDVEFTFVKGKWQSLGEATLMNRVKSHPDVGERWVSLCLLLASIYPHDLTVVYVYDSTPNSSLNCARMQLPLQRRPRRRPRRHPRRLPISKQCRLTSEPAR